MKTTYLSLLLALSTAALAAPPTHSPSVTTHLAPVPSTACAPSPITVPPHSFTTPEPKSPLTPPSVEKAIPERPLRPNPPTEQPAPPPCG